MKPYEILENLSLSTGLGISAIDVTGRKLFESSQYTADFLKTFHAILDIGEADHVALLYGCYQSRRFGGRYIFIVPSGLTYCASPLSEEDGEMASGVLAGPFLLTDRDEFMEIDLNKFGPLNSGASQMIRDRLETVPVLEPAKARSISELLYICALHGGYGNFISPYAVPGYPYDGQNGQAYNGQASYAANGQNGQAYSGQAGYAANGQNGQVYSGQAGYTANGQAVLPPAAQSGAQSGMRQAGVFTTAYPIEKENELLSAISLGDFRRAGEPLNEILGQILFQSGGDLTILRSRVVELTVLLSRAALKGGANMDAIFGLNYNYLREIDALGTLDDIIEWLYGVTRRFAQHVFDFPRDRKDDVTARAAAYMRTNFTGKISLKDVADHVFMSPTYFCKVFKEKTGRTPGVFIAGLRIEESRKLLRDPRVNIADIPALVGFESQSYFTRVFKKVEGCTPGKYRQIHEKDHSLHAV